MVQAVVFANGTVPPLGSGEDLSSHASRPRWGRVPRWASTPPMMTIGVRTAGSGPSGSSRHKGRGSPPGASLALPRVLEQDAADLLDGMRVGLDGVGGLHHLLGGDRLDVRAPVGDHAVA